MKKIILTALSFMLLSHSHLANAKEYSEENTKFCSKNEELTCDLNDNPITGVVKTYYEDGQLKSEENFKNGGYDGLQKWYYEDGLLSVEENYKDNQLEGTLKYYWYNGKIRCEGDYNAGNGTKKCYTSDGILDEEVIDKDDITTIKKYYEYVHL